jgi:hypothetical protein
MKILDWIEEDGAAFAVSAVAGFLAAIGAWVAAIFVGAKFFRDEWSYGVPLAFGFPAALVGGAAVFVIVFRRLRPR